MHRSRGEKTDLIYFTMPSPLFSSAYLARFARRVIHRASDRFPTSAIYALRSNDTRKPIINEYGFHWGIWFVLFPRRVTRFRGVPSPGITALFGPSQRAETRRSTFKSVIAQTRICNQLRLIFWRDIVVKGFIDRYEGGCFKIVCGE